MSKKEKMKLRKIYRGFKAEEYKLRIVDYDRNPNDRPAWIRLVGLTEKVYFISIHLGKKGKKGRRMQFYRAYLFPGLFLPIDYTSEEMEKFYNQMAKIYDKEMLKSKQNIHAAKFLVKRLKKYVKKPENFSIVDLGAGTGLITEVYIDEGFKDITLIDYSQKMLDKARKRKKLKKCKFLKANILKFNLKSKSDLIVSHFSLAEESYFNKKQLNKILQLIKKNLKKNGLIAVIGHFDINLFKKYFKELDSGIYTLNEADESWSDYFIGRKKWNIKYQI